MVGTVQWWAQRNGRLRAVVTEHNCGTGQWWAQSSGGHNAVVQAQCRGGHREAQWGMVADEIVISVNESLTL